MKGVKYDEEKPRFDLLPMAEVEGVVRVLTLGSQKYYDDNWKKVENGRQCYYAAAMRHLSVWKQGELLDQETGESHLSHAMCCLLFLAWLDNEESKGETSPCKTENP